MNGRDGTPLTPLRLMTADQIVREFVADAVAFYPTNLQRMVNGLQLVAKRRGITLEQATQDMISQYHALTGRDFPTQVA